MKNYIKGWNGYSKIHEQKEEEEITQEMKDRLLYGAGRKPVHDLMDKMDALVQFVNRANPTSVDSIEQIREEIDEMKSEILSHPSYEELKNGIQFQDSIVNLDDFKKDLADAIRSFQRKIDSKGFMK
jgi:Mg2+ and Co2+ transporter CorA